MFKPTGEELTEKFLIDGFAPFLRPFVVSIIDPEEILDSALRKEYLLPMAEISERYFTEVSWQMDAIDIDTFHRTYHGFFVGTLMCHLYGFFVRNILKRTIYKYQKPYYGFSILHPDVAHREAVEMLTEFRALKNNSKKVKYEVDSILSMFAMVHAMKDSTINPYEYAIVVYRQVIRDINTLYVQYNLHPINYSNNLTLFYRTNIIATWDLLTK